MTYSPVFMHIVFRIPPPKKINREDLYMSKKIGQISNSELKSAVEMEASQVKIPIGFHEKKNIMKANYSLNEKLGYIFA